MVSLRLLFGAAAASVVTANLVAREVSADGEFVDAQVGDISSFIQTDSAVQPRRRGLRVANSARQESATAAYAVGPTGTTDEVMLEAMTDIFLLQTAFQHSWRGSALEDDAHAIGFEDAVIEAPEGGEQQDVALEQEASQDKGIQVAGHGIEVAGAAAAPEAQEAASEQSAAPAELPAEGKEEAGALAEPEAKEAEPAVKEAEPVAKEAEPVAKEVEESALMQTDISGASNLVAATQAASEQSAPPAEPATEAKEAVVQPVALVQTAMEASPEAAPKVAVAATPAVEEHVTESAAHSWASATGATVKRILLESPGSLVATATQALAAKMPWSASSSLGSSASSSSSSSPPY